MAAIELPIDNLEQWTFEDLTALPESPWRFEIVDGGLHMTPPPSIAHDGVWLRLRDLIRDVVPSTHRVHGPTAIDLQPSYLIPDLAVIDASADRFDRNLVLPSEMLLVVEVVSPGSVSADRFLKPAKYAEAGIPHFWRVETRPEISLAAYSLPDGADTYTEVGTWTAGVTAPLREPFEVDIPIAELAPDR